MQITLHIDAETLDSEYVARSKVEKAKSAIQECIDGMIENGKYHAEPIRHNGEMTAVGLQMALDIIDEYCGGDKNA